MTQIANSMNGGRRTFRSMPQRQRGVVLLVTLIVLVAMMLAGIGMIRSVDTGTLIAGNVAFREATVQAGERGMNDAYVQLLSVASSANPYDKLVLNYQTGTSPTLVQGTITTNVCSLVTATLCVGGAIKFDGYSATPINPCEIYPPSSPANACPQASMYQWWTDPNAWATAPTKNVYDNNGKVYATVSYLIHRMCFSSDVYPNATGQLCQTQTQVVDTGSHRVGDPGFTATLVYYRITTRAVGPRNTIAYAQQLVVIAE
jgi:type IV pilus assembly protein PilX